MMVAMFVGLHFLYGFKRARGAYMRATVAPTNVNCNTALFYPSFSRDRIPLLRS